MEILQREWEYFLLLCEAGSMTKAAELLGLQQAALSKSIKKLEEAIGKKLFIRLGRGVKPTEYGLLLERELRALQEIWEERMEQGLSQVESLAGVYSLAIHPTVAMSSLASSFSEVTEPHPHLKCELVFTTSKEALRKVVAHEVDLAVVVKPEAHPELVIKPLHKEKVFLYEGEKATKEAEEVQVLYYHPDMVSLSQVLKKYQKWQKVPIANYEVLAQIGQYSRGLTLLPEPVAQRVGGLKPVSKAIGDVPLALIYRYDRLKTKGFEYLKENLYQKIKERN
jgi:DNA-binding transcriptional LysR family regulator